MKQNNLEKFLGYNPKSSLNEIYALCDFETLEKKSISFKKFIEIVSSLDVKIIQYRDKISNFETKKKNLNFLKDNINLPIIINDDLSLLPFADGLHLGQEDLLEIQNKMFKLEKKELVFKILRKKYSNKLFGLSTHNEKEILEANNFDIDMIGLGAYRNTSTKNVSEIVGNKMPYLAKISKHPVCAIGGVKLDETIDNVSFKVIGSGLYE